MKAHTRLRWGASSSAAVCLSLKSLAASLDLESIPLMLCTLGPLPDCGLKKGESAFVGASPASCSGCHESFPAAQTAVLQEGAESLGLGRHGLWQTGRWPSNHAGGRTLYVGRWKVGVRVHWLQWELGAEVAR